MREHAIALQFRDPTGTTAVNRVNREPYGRRKFRVIQASQIAETTPISPTPVAEVNPVNGVKVGHQTGVRTMHSLEIELAKLRKHYITGDVSRAELKMQKRLLLGELRNFQSASRR